MGVIKPIIIDINNCSESVEVYESKPNHFMIYTIYTVLAIVVTACIWMSFFKIDDVIKSNGLFRNSEEIYEVGSAVTGVVKEKNVTDGDYVNKGDILYVVESESLSNTILMYSNNLKNAKERLDMLDAYEESLDGSFEILERMSENQYYEEFKNRRELLLNNIENNAEEINNKTILYDKNIQSISDTIQKNKDKINKINEVKACILSRNNTIDEKDGYYYSIVSSYISSYKLTEMQYNNETEKKQVLSNLENQKLLELEQMIEDINSSLITLNTNLETAELEKLSFSDKSGTYNRNNAILTEKGNISGERLTLNEKIKEYENCLNEYNNQSENCTIKASVSGYYYDRQNLNPGSYVQKGNAVGQIYPEKESDFYAEVYIKNSDIGRIKEGQDVKMEIAAYPSKEYGYFKGKIVSISKDISVDESTGYAYYVAKVKCDNMYVENKNGDVLELKNGMACQAKIIVGDKTVMTYVLEKINLTD